MRLAVGQVHRRLPLFGAGPGESTTDLAWDGHALIYENGDLLAESERFADREQMITADIDLERLVQDRMRMTSFNDSVGDCRERVQAIRRIRVRVSRARRARCRLQRDVARFPYVPSDPRERDQRCFEAYNIQVHGLLKRLSSTGTQARGHRHLRRPGLDPGAHRRGQDHGPAGPAAEEHPGLHHARLRHQRAHARATRTS